MSESKTIGRAALIVSVGILLSRVLGLGRNVLLNSVLGLDVGNDLYQAAFTIPDYLFFLMAGGYLTITLVPILARHLAAGDHHEAQRSFASVFAPVVGLMAVLTLAMIVFARPLTSLFFPRLSTDQLAPMMRIAFASQIFFIAGTLLMAVQYAHRRFVVPTLAPIIYNLGIIGGGLFGWLGGDSDPKWFLWGGLLGAAAGNFGLQWWGASRLGIHLFRGADRRHPAVREYLVLALPLMVGQSAVALDENWARWFGQLSETGTISGLVNARQLNMLPVGVIAQAAGVAAFPFLARLVSQGDTQLFRTTVDRSVRSALVVSGLATAGVMVLAPDIVQLAFQRGEFDQADTALVASLLLIYAISIPMWTAHQIYTRAFYALRRMWLPVAVGTAITAVTVPSLWWLAPRGASAIAAVSTASMLAYTLVIAGAWRRAGGPLPPASTLAKTGLTSVLSGAAGWLVVSSINGEATVDAFSRFLLGGSVIVLTYLLAGRLLRLEELTGLRRRDRGRPAIGEEPDIETTT